MLLLAALAHAGWTANGSENGCAFFLGSVAIQVHEASGISDREVALLFGEEAIGGGKRYTWTMSPDQSAARRGTVPLALDTGKWEITSTPSGARVVYELRYDAGGSVPGFLVRWFQGSGLRTLVGELRTWAETHG